MRGDVTLSWFMERRPSCAISFAGHAVKMVTPLELSQDGVQRFELTFYSQPPEIVTGADTVKISDFKD